MTRRSKFVSGCFVLGLAQYFLYSVNFEKFFQGDALFWMHYRFHSMGEFIRALVTLDVGNWYRPLSNRIIPSVFYSSFGLEPFPYHLVVFASFFALSCLVLGFLDYVTRNHVIAFIGAFYFSIHSSNVYPTYDFAFSPEVFYVFFYVSSVWIFIEGERRGSRRWRAVSAVLFTLSLMSKEAAVSLPAMLVVSHLALVRTGWKSALRASAIHFGVLALYTAYIVGFLKVGGGDYMLGIHNVPRNLISAIAYAFNFRIQGYLPTRSAATFVLIFLALFAVTQIILGLVLLRREQRRVLIFGMGWFLIGLGPMMFLNVFGPYYAFLAMVGFSLSIGVTIGTLIQSRLIIAGILAMLWVSCRSLIAADTATDTALGYASLWAENSMVDMLDARSDLPSGSTIYIFDEAVPDLWRFHGLGSLFKLVYGDNSIRTAYRSTGATPRSDSGELVVFKAEAEHLVDITDDFKEAPSKFLGRADESKNTYVERPGVTLRVTPEEVVAGRDFYWLIVKGLETSDVVVQYTVNDGPIAEATFRLNPEGGVRFFVSELTEIGEFRFVRFRPAAGPSTEWIRADVTLRVLKPVR